jgi:hypothetical protein
MASMADGSRASAQSFDINMFISSAFGLLTLSIGAALIVDHYRNRRR